MQVIKRNGRKEPVSFDKVVRRLELIAKGVYKNGRSFGEALDIDVLPVAQKVIREIRDGITTRELDEFAASTCASMVMENLDYGTMAGRVIISNHQKNTRNSFYDTIQDLYDNRDKSGKSAPLIGYDTYKIVSEYKDQIEAMIDYDRDFRIDFFGFKTLEKSYFLTTELGPKFITERPQHLWMRVAVGIHQDDLESVKQTYDLLSLGKLMHATPTLFNAGTPTPQLSSCYLIDIYDSLLEYGGIADVWKQCAAVSKYMGGIGLCVSKIRAKESIIRSSGRVCDGLVPLLRVFNDIAKYINQGGRRKGSIAAYVEPWHADIFDFLDMKKTHGDQERRALDLFYALWIPDLFMERVEQALSLQSSSSSSKSEIMWSLMCPDECPGLVDLYGDAFNKQYEDYEKQGKFKQQVPVMKLWQAILDSQKESGTPYMMYKDHVNHRNNQGNLGTITSSNLCSEIVQYSNAQQGLIACCNLASIPVCSYYMPETNSFDFQGLHDTTITAVRNLDRIIDVNFYPVVETSRSNFQTRPCAIGVQGLQDLFCKLRIAFDSKEAAVLNREIFETMYYAALKGSMELAKERGKYPKYEGSPLSQGKFQWDLWNDHVDWWNNRRQHTFNSASNPSFTSGQQQDQRQHAVLNGRWNWEELRQDILQHGVRNSLLISQMPCASTAQIQGNCESFEPFTRNVYVRRVLSGEFKIINSYMQKDLMAANLWTDIIRTKIIRNRGSIQNIEEIPEHIRLLYKDAFEIKQKVIIDQAHDRSPFVDQSQSMNIFIESPNDSKLTTMHMYGWKHLLKTGMYYLRREANANAIQFTVKPISKDAEPKLDSTTSSANASLNSSTVEIPMCRKDNPECLACQ